MQSTLIHSPSTRHPRPPKARARVPAPLVAAVLLGAATLSAQKATAPKAPDASRVPVQTVWPLPPDTPRVSFVAVYENSYDIEGVPPKPKLESWRETLLGRDVAGSSRGPKRFGKPYGVAVDSMGRAIVADTERCTVFVIDAERKRFTELGAGGQQAFLRIPIGVAVDDKDNIYVSDNGHGVVMVFGPDLAFRKTLTTPGDLEAPTGLAFDSTTNRLYVVDTRRHTLSAFDASSGQLVKRIGQKGNGDGEFGWPSGVAVGKDGRVYVSDTMNYRVQIFDRDMKFVRSFGSLGVNPGQFRRPKGIAVDEDNVVYVVDSDFNNFQMFDTDGHPLLFVGSFGQRPGQMILPAGIAVSKGKRRIFVAEQVTKRIQVFDRVGQETGH